MKRNTNIEILRILCILGITAHHLVYHSTIMEEPIGGSRLFAQFFLLFGKSGVNIFVLISGYFLVKTDALDYKGAVKRALKLWKQLILYSLMLGGGYYVLLGRSISAPQIAKTLFPTATGAYWFMTSFIGLMLLVPFLNYLAQNISRDQYKKLLLVLIVILIIPPMNTWSNDLLWFVAVYLTAGYLRLHKLEYLTTQKRRFFVGVGCLAVMWAASVVLSVAALKIPALEQYINYFAFRQNSPFMYVGSVAIFLWILGLKPTYVGIVNKAAKHVLPCYLIQSNVFFSSILWKAVDSIVPRSAFYPVVVIAVIAVLVICFMLVDVAVEIIFTPLKMIGRRKKCDH